MSRSISTHQSTEIRRGLACVNASNVLEYRRSEAIPGYHNCEPTAPHWCSRGGSTLTLQFEGLELVAADNIEQPCSLRSALHIAYFALLLAPCK